MVDFCDTTSRLGWLVLSAMNVYDGEEYRPGQKVLLVGGNSD
jgi:hypothetical protein